jgi:two-component system chemotaxis family response regulator WspR
MTSRLSISTMPDRPAGAEVGDLMVLLVDDQAMIGEAVRRMLADEAGIDFHYCNAPGEAIAVADRIRPAVILQDLVMPGVDGLDLVRGYRALDALADTPILVLSSREDARVKSQAFAAGANDYLVKLPDAIELVARIRYHARAYMALKQRDEANRALRLSQQQLQESNLALQRLMKSDGLTGLANRRHLDEFLVTEWLRGRRSRSQISLLLVDVDHFKSYNDHFGHVMGDDALRAVAQALTGVHGRATDLAARYGGEEFVMVLPETPSDGARLLAERLRRSVEALAIPHVHPAAGAVVTVSVGIATLVPDEAREPVALIELADLALYQAKKQGRNRIEMAPL